MLAGYLDNDSEPISCITAMKYERNVGFIGYYIVRNQTQRGSGYGLQLFKKALDYLGTDCNIGLDGVVEQQHNYQKSGFSKVWDNIRFFGKPAVAAPGVPPANTFSIASSNPSESFVTAVSEFEALYSGCRRPDSFLAAWLKDARITSFIVGSTPDTLALSVDKIEGFGSIRPSATGFRIGPLYAKSPAVASWIAASLVRSIKGAEEATVYADVCMANDKAAAVFNGIGLSGEGGFVTGRMWTKGMPIPQHRVSGVFAVMTLEIA
ncbi:hypothetical protein HDU67_001349 [Dinochytrium kinnereticum]|nr:hypothetical protein HDU67_001349 [Dinochytrium kinnereticum]